MLGLCLSKAPARSTQQSPTPFREAATLCDGSDNGETPKEVMEWAGLLVTQHLIDRTLGKGDYRVSHGGKC